MTIEVVSKRRGYRKQDGDVYVGRPTEWGNPFEIGKHGTRDEVIAKYDQWLDGKLPHPTTGKVLSADEWEGMMMRLDAAEPKRLVCWCAPSACHATPLIEHLMGWREDK